MNLTKHVQDLYLETLPQNTAERTWTSNWREIPVHRLEKWASEKLGHLLEILQRVWVSESLSRVRLFMMLWTVACQAPLSMGFSMQEYWSGLPFPSNPAAYQDLNSGFLTKIWYSSFTLSVLYGLCICQGLLMRWCIIYNWLWLFWYFFQCLPSFCFRYAYLATVCPATLKEELGGKDEKSTGTWRRKTGTWL